MVDANPAQCRKLFRQRQCPHRIKVEPPQADIAVKCAERQGVGLETEFSEVKVTAFETDVRIELVAAIDFVGSVPVPVGN